MSSLVRQVRICAEGYVIFKSRRGPDEDLMS